MINLTKSLSAACLAAAFAVGAAMPATAKTCFKKAGVGEATTKKGAQFQVDEVLLQATDWGAWAAWMTTGTTPGYTFGKRYYKCSKGGTWGWKCYGQARICKL